MYGQQSGWTSPNASLFKYNASVISTMYLDSTRSNHAEDRIALFAGNELRGLSVPIFLGGGNYIHFITVFSNVGTEVLDIKIYHATTGQIYDATTKLTFQVQGWFGTVDDPFKVHAFSNNDAPISIQPIPPQLTIEGLPFEPIQLNDYLIQPDNDAVVWTAMANANLSVGIQGSVLTVSGNNGFSGNTVLRVRATEQTPGQHFAEADISFEVTSAYPPPAWKTIPGQGIVLGSTFTPFDLPDFEYQYGGPCQKFSYKPLMNASDQPDAIPNWLVSGHFQNNMTIIARVIYTPEHVFNHADDKIAAFIGNEVRGVATPVNTGNGVLYFLTVGGGTNTESLTIRFYSGQLQRVLTLHSPLNYVPYRIEGSADAPFAMDFSPLVPILDSLGHVNVVIKDTSWTGEQTFIFKSEDCLYPEFLYDTTNASFCIVEEPFYLTQYFIDNDGDGYGSAGSFVYACSDPGDGYVENNSDCDDTNPDIVGLLVQIQVSENSALVTNDGLVCSMANVTLNASGGTQYLWNTGSTSQSISINPAITTSYTVTVTNGQSCTGSKTQTIYVEGHVVVNSLDSGSGSLRSVLECVTDGGTILYDQPVTNSTVLIAPLDIEKNVFIQGLSPTMRPEITIDFNQTINGINVQENKTLYLRNVDIKLINPLNSTTFTGAGNVHIQQFSKITKQ